MNRSHRRKFLLASGALLAAPLARAQRARKVYRIGTLHTTSSDDAANRLAALERGLSALGYIVGRDVAFINSYAGSEVNRLPQLAAELVRSDVDVIVTSVNPGTVAAMKATMTIPIVMTIGVEPVAAGLIASLAKPGGNVTGLTFDVDATQLAAKRLEILKDLIPSLTRVAVLWNPSFGPGALRFRGTEDAGRKLGITIMSVQLSDRRELERAFAEMRQARTQALTVLSDPGTVAWRSEITQRAAQYRLPAIYALREFVEAGGLISYAASLLDQYRRAASYIDRIIKGAKPGDLPVEQPITFELILNLKTAKALELKISRDFLGRVDSVVQ